MYIYLNAICESCERATESTLCNMSPLTSLWLKPPSFVVISHSFIVCTFCTVICLCLCVFSCVCACLSACPVCFVSLQSADKDTVPAQLFPARLPPRRLQLQASTSSPLLSSSPLFTLPHLLSPPSPTLPCYSLPIISLLLCHWHSAAPPPSLRPPPLCSLLLMSKLKNITLSGNPRLSHALGDEHPGRKNNLSLKIG